ncbi:MAG TPA: cytochrome b/b6 domain-containing protein [Burkholderiaceae bacterium]|nr:cytochrome b/b6 domain-containing protein [Burkholderiaceae bacterium]
MNTTPTRYSSALVALHWLLALLLPLALLMGTVFLAATPNSEPEKIGALRAHMIVGSLIGTLMLVRLIVRWRSAKPAAVSSGSAAMNAFSKFVHGALYLLVFMMAGSGMGTALSAGLPDIVFFGVGTLPANFDAYLPRAVHGLVAKGLMLLIALHVLGAVMHQFRFKDNLLARMWFKRG